jgi:hypothetical protein
MRKHTSPFGGGGGRGALVRYSAERIVEEFAAGRLRPKAKQTRRKRKKKRRA